MFLKMNFFLVFCASSNQYVIKDQTSFAFDFDADPVAVLYACFFCLRVVILTSNLVLRVSEIYVFHFNDSQVIREIPYNVTERDMAAGISSYWSSFSGESFQETSFAFDFDADPVAVLYACFFCLRVV